MNLRAIEDRRSVAEDEVDAALYIGVEIILPAIVGKERVLVAEKPAMFEDDPVGTHSGGDGLSSVAGSVLEREVVGLESVAVDLDCLREKGPAGLLRIQAVGDHDIGGRFPHPHAA